MPQLIQKFNYSLCFLGVKGTLRTPCSMAATWEKRATAQNALEKQENALKQHVRETELLKEDVERTDRECDPSSSLCGWKSLGLSTHSIFSGSYSLSEVFPVPSSLPQHHAKRSIVTKRRNHSKKSLFSIKHRQRQNVSCDRRWLFGTASQGCLFTSDHGHYPMIYLPHTAEDPVAFLVYGRGQGGPICREVSTSVVFSLSLPMSTELIDPLALTRDLVELFPSTSFH